MSSKARPVAARPGVRTWSAVLSAAIVFGSACAENKRVETPETAIAAARAGWKTLAEQSPGAGEHFSQAAIARFEPYTATLDGGVWTVQGTVPPGYDGPILLTTVRADTGAVAAGMITEPVMSP